MVSIGFALAACMGWGIADFIGGLKSRQVSTLKVLIIANGTGVLMFAGILGISKHPMPSPAALAWAVPAGLMGIASMYLLYRGLAVGVMSVLAPISATGALLPVGWGLFNGEALCPGALAGLFMAFSGALLAARAPAGSEGGARWTRGVNLAVAAAVCIGFYFILMGRACACDPLWASAVMRTTTFIFLMPAVCFMRPPGNRPEPRPSSYLPPIIFMGIMDSLAAFSFTLAAVSGMLSISAVVSSLYPAVTVLLSAFILGERLQPVQLAGVALTLAGVVQVSALYS